MHPTVSFLGYTFSTYFLTLAFAYTVGVQYFFIRAAKAKLNSNIAADFLLISFLSGLLGARLFYVFYVDPKYYLNHPDQIYALWKGGFVYYGGFLLSLICGIFYLRLRKQNILKWLDVAAPVASLTYAIGRGACFLNGCCYGSLTALWTGVYFPHLEGYRHPTQLYVSFYEVLIWLFLILFLSNKVVIKSRTGILFFIWLFFHSLGRLMMEYFRADDRGSDILGFSVSANISVVILFISLIWIFYNFKNNNSVKH